MDDFCPTLILPNFLIYKQNYYEHQAKMDIYP